MATLHFLQAQRALVCDRENRFISKSRDDLFASLLTAAANFAACTSPPVPQEGILPWSKLVLFPILIPYPPFRQRTESPTVTLLAKVAKADAMESLDIRVLILLVLFASASLAYPYDTRSRSLILTNDASPEVHSQVNLTDLGRSYPVYPTTCFPSPPRGRPLPLPDIASMLSDCYWIINEVLLRQDKLLFQDLLFGYSWFKDVSGNRYLSRWHRGHCVIHVACVERHEKQRLELFNVVLAANKILKECVQDQRIPQGGTTPIGSVAGSFYVGVLGEQDSDAANASNVSLLSTLELPGQDIPRSIPHTKSKKKSSFDDFDSDNSVVALPLSVSRKKRASDPQHSSSLLIGTQSLVPGDALSSSNLHLPSLNLSESVKAPPSYPIECFNPYFVKRKPAVLKDCQFIINHIILTYPNPMTPQTFGYTNSADIDLSLPQNEKWAFGNCVMFVRNVNKTQTDTFRMVDVAYTAHRIMTECVSGVKYPVGGTADVGTVAGNFYVAVGGL